MEQDPSRACHGGFLAADIVSFNSSKRTDQDLVSIRRSLQGYVENAFGEIPFEREYCADGGDAVLAITSSEAEKSSLFLQVIPELERQVRRHNRDFADRLKIQLRLAIHFGEYTKDQPSITKKGIAGREINKVFRLLDAKSLRQGITLAPEQQPLVGLISDEFYQKILLQQTPERLTNLAPCIVDTKEGNQLEAWAFGFVPAVRTVNGTADSRPANRPKTRSSRTTTAKGSLKILKEFMAQMDAIWEENFDAAWNAIHTVDYTTERTVNQKLDLFFQQYHGVFHALVTQSAHGRELRKLGTKAIAAAWQLAASSWELVANARMGELHEYAKTGRVSRNLLDAADGANRRGLAAESPQEKCGKFREAVDVVHRCLQGAKGDPAT